jgi:hypothetical protein
MALRVFMGESDLARMKLGTELKDYLESLPDVYVDRQGIFVIGRLDVF